MGCYKTVPYGMAAWKKRYIYRLFLEGHILPPEYKGVIQAFFRLFPDSPF